MSRNDAMKQGIPLDDVKPKEKSTLAEQERTRTRRDFDPLQPAGRIADDGGWLLCSQNGVWLYHHGTRAAHFVTDSQFDIPAALNQASQIEWSKRKAGI